MTSTGKLAWRGGLQISSSDPRFGGLSALHVSGDGRRLIALSDKGRWITARLRYDSDGHLDGIGDAEIGPLMGPDGNPVAGTVDGDAESLAITGDATVVAFEGRHRLWSYAGAPPAFSHLPTRLPRLPDIARAHRNRGIEALAALFGGRLLAVAEDFPPKRGDLHGWVSDQGVWRALSYARTGRFLPVGATVLPGGDLVVLERRFTWLGGLASRIVRIAAESIQPGARLVGKQLALLAAPLVSENFEGIATRRGRDGATLIYLVSDDNFHMLQVTLLVMFALMP
jgi:hypothetical protein